MEKRRNVLVCALAVLLVMTVLFSGCSLEQAKEIAQKAQNEVVETALETTVDFMVDSALTEYEPAAPVAECLQARVNLQVTNSQITADGMLATCDVYAPDVTDFIENFDINDYLIDEETLDEEKLINAITAAINAAPLTKQTVTIGLESKDGQYVPKDIEPFINAYTGGALDLLLEMQEEYAK
jgi:hypothetical protein